jgi:two-component system, response regulator PdtaR
MILGGIKLENAKILVVEDERITAEDIKRSLEKTGYIVPAIVSTGEDAVKFSEKYKPDLVLMDIVLDGKVDGIEAAETIRTKFAIPVIYLTAYSDKDTVERAKTTNPSAFILKEPYGFIHKPFEENELYTAIDIILSRNKEEKILKSHDELLVSLLKTISDGVIVTDSEKKIKLMNSAAEKITGYNKEKSIGKKFFEVFHVPGLKIDVSEEVKLNDNLDEEIFLESKNGTKTPIDGTLTPIKNKNGVSEDIIIIFRLKQI